jgi:hypothetical protein
LKAYPSERPAAIESPTEAITIYRKHNKPSYDPLGNGRALLETHSNDRRAAKHPLAGGAMKIDAITPGSGQ